MPGWLARSLTSDCRMESLAKMGSVTCPVLLVFGEADTLCPPAMNDRLAVAAKGPVTKHLVAGVSHNSMWNGPATGLDRTVYDWVRAIGAKRTQN